MSSSALASRRSWPPYGEVPMTRCLACPRTAPLKRLVTTTDKNGNLGREFVKCQSKQEQGKKLKQCAHFEWLDEYIERIQLEGASRKLDRFTVGSGEVWIWGPWIWQFHWCYCEGCNRDGRAEEAQQADEETNRIEEAGQFDGRNFLCLCNCPRICLCDDN
ncbi:hypothetical protein ZWY2020_019379 [Hordeum vulgare]|uniref:GRF-type domain-containing protein n=1 Tax=Hordeum vulgare subsp. vulgare TaxID=112509 RepID=A0A8I6XZZ1_HORVV|nr:hypothetical protein ZWY2020_019379 [Hordeum vulgare]